MEKANKPKAVFKAGWPYLEDKMNLPVADVAAAIPFYESMLGFQVVERRDTPVRSVILGRDDVQIGLAENGGDPSQEGCFFEVDHLETAFAELRANGLGKKQSDAFSTEQHGETTWKVFFVVAPDGLCYCIGERQN